MDVRTYIFMKPFKEHKYQNSIVTFCYFPLKHIQKTNDWFNGLKFHLQKNLTWWAKMKTACKVNIRGTDTYFML